MLYNPNVQLISGIFDVITLIGIFQTNLLLDFKARPFFFRANEVTDDHLKIEWCDLPASNTGDAVFHADFFAKAKTIQRHILPIKYNS